MKWLKATVSIVMCAATYIAVRAMAPHYENIVLALDPGTAALIATGLNFMFGGDSRNTSGFEPSDVFRTTRRTLGPETQSERGLVDIINSLARSAGQIGQEPLPGGLTLESLAAGEIPQASQTRIREQAFAGVDEGLRRAQVRAGEAALGRGLGPASSFEATAYGELARPLLSEAAGREAALGQQELGRLGELREKTISNLMALQDMPALSRLLQIRMAETEQNNLQLSRFPGGLPPWVADILGLPPIGGYRGLIPPGSGGKVDDQGRLIGVNNPNLQTGGKGPTISDPGTGREYDYTGRRIDNG